MRQLSNEQRYYRMPGLKSSGCKHHTFLPRPCVLTSGSFLKESVVPYANQNVGGAYPTGIGATIDSSTQAWSVTPQAPVCSLILFSWA